MKDELISFKTAKLAKEKGFNWKCLFYYGDCRTPIDPILVDPDGQFGRGYILENYNSKEWSYNKWSAPTQSLLQKWLRDTQNVSVETYISYQGWEVHVATIKANLFVTKIFISEKQNFNSYEEALEKGLQKALKLIK